MDISVGIVTRNRKKSLDETLNSIEKLTLRPYEIIVVENSTNKTLTTLVGKHSSLGIRYFSVKNIGIANCRNLILKKARGEVVCFIDDDCVLPKFWLESVSNVFKKDKSTVAVVGKSENYYKSSFVAKMEQKLYETWLSQYLDITKPHKLLSGIFVNTRNFSVKKSFVERNKLNFDPRAPFKLEDTDFGIKLYARMNPDKESLVYSPRFFVYHKNSKNLSDFIKRRFVSRKGAEYLRKKYSSFETLPKSNENAFAKLQEGNFWVWWLFFIERQYLRLEAFVKRGEILIDVERGYTKKIW